jgi:hypothetical protein
MEHPINVDRLSPEVAKVCGPDVPARLRTMAARGLAPLSPRDLISALYVLAYDADESLRKTAQGSLRAMPAKVLLGAVEQVEQGEVLDGLAHLLISNIEATENILLNRYTEADAVVFIAKKAESDRTLEVVASNQERMLKHPEIIEALYNNKRTRMSTVDRAIELAVRNNVELKGIACFAEVKAAIHGELITEATDEPAPEDAAFLESLESSDWQNLDEETVDAAFEDSEKESKEEARAKVESVEQELARLNVSAKIRVATLGNAIQRAVLIRDSNKLVVVSVVKSPGLNESEVFRYSQFRSLPEEAIRCIASNREWTKHYTVKFNLIKNPRCPLEYSLRFMPHLRLNDLRGLGRDKNIPQAVARAARQLLQKRI